MEKQKYIYYKDGYLEITIPTEIKDYISSICHCSETGKVKVKIIKTAINNQI